MAQGLPTTREMIAELIATPSVSCVHADIDMSNQGVIDKLDYLQELGITAIWFNPVFAARSLHKYDANSFHHIDPTLDRTRKGIRR